MSDEVVQEIKKDIEVSKLDKVMLIKDDIEYCKEYVLMHEKEIYALLMSYVIVKENFYIHTSSNILAIRFYSNFSTIYPELNNEKYIFPNIDCALTFILLVK